MGKTLDDMGNSETSRIFTKPPMYSYKTLLKKFHMHINDTCHAFVKNLVNLECSIILRSIPIGSENLLFIKKGYVGLSKSKPSSSKVKIVFELELF